MAGDTLPPVIAVLEGDIEDAIEKIDQLKEALGSLDSTEATATANVQTDEAEAKVDDLRDSLASLDADEATATANVETAEGEAAVDSLEASLGGLDAEPVEVTPIVDTAPGIAAVEGLRADLESLGAEGDIGGLGDVEATLDGLRNNLNLARGDVEDLGTALSGAEGPTIGASDAWLQLTAGFKHWDQATLDAGERFAELCGRIEDVATASREAGRGFADGQEMLDAFGLTAQQAGDDWDGLLQRVEEFNANAAEMAEKARSGTLSIEEIDRAFVVLGYDAGEASQMLDDVGVGLQEAQQIANEAGLDIEDLAGALRFAADNAIPFAEAAAEVRDGVLDIGYAAEQASPFIDSLKYSLEELEKLGQSTGLNLDNITKRLKQMGLASVGAGGDLVDMDGNLVTASEVVSQFGVVLDRGTISLTGFNEALERFAAEGMAETQAAAMEALFVLRDLDDELDALAETADDAALSLDDVTEAMRVEMAATAAAASATAAFEEGMAAAEAAAAEEESAVAALTDGLLGVGDAEAAAGGDTISFGDALKGVGKAGSKLSDALPGLMGILWAIAPALLDVAAAAIGVVGAMIGMAEIAGIGIVGFALGVVANLGAVEQALKGLKAEFDEWGKGFAPIIAPFFQAFARDLPGVLNRLTPLVIGSSIAFEALGHEIDQAFMSEGFERWIAFVASEAEPTLVRFGAFIRDLVSAFGDMAENGIGFINQMENGLVSMAQDLEKFAEGNTFKDWVDWLETEGPVIGRFFETTAATIGDFLSKLAPVGNAIIDVLTPFEHFLQDLMNFDGPVTSVVLGLAGLVFILVSVASAGAGMIVLFSKLISLFRSAAEALGLFEGVAAGGAEEGAAGGILGGLGDGIGALAGGLADLLPVLGPVAVGVGIVASSMHEASVQNAQFNAEVQKANKALDSLPTRTAKQAIYKEDALNTAISVLEEQFAKPQHLQIGSPLFLADLNNAASGGAPVGTGATALGSGYTAKAEVEARRIEDYIGQINKTQLRINGLAEVSSNLTELRNRFGLTNKAAEQTAKVFGINLTHALNPHDLKEFASMVSYLQAQVAKETPFQKFNAEVKSMSKAANAAGQAAASAFNQSANAATHFADKTNVSGQEIIQFFEGQVTAAKQFAQNEATALAKGVPPGLVQQFAAEGAAAGGAGMKALANMTQNQVIHSRITWDAKLDDSNLLSSMSKAITDMQSKNAAVASVARAGALVVNAIMSGSGTKDILAYSKTLSGGLPEIAEISTMLGLTLPKGVVSAIDSKYGSLKNAVKAFGKSVDGQNIDGTSLGTSLANSAAKGVTDGGKTLKATTERTVRAAIQEAHSVSAKDVGTHITTTMASGVTSGSKDVQDALSQVMKDAITTGKGTDTSDVGRSMADGFAQGISGDASRVEDAAKEVIRDAIASAKAIDATSVGTRLDMTIASGITNDASDIEGALRSAVNSAIAAVSNINASSVGESIATSIAAGVTASAGTITTAVRSATSAATTAGANVHPATPAPSGGTSTIHTHVILDGKEVATAIAGPLRSVQAKAARATRNIYGPYAGTRR